MYGKNKENSKEILATIKNIEKAIKQTLNFENYIKAKTPTNIHSLLTGT